MTSHNLFLMLDDAIVGLVLFFLLWIVVYEIDRYFIGKYLPVVFFINRYFMTITFDFIVVLRDSLSILNDWTLVSFSVLFEFIHLC